MKELALGADLGGGTGGVGISERSSQALPWRLSADIYCPESIRDNRDDIKFFISSASHVTWAGAILPHLRGSITDVLEYRIEQGHLRYLQIVTLNPGLPDDHPAMVAVRTQIHNIDPDRIRPELNRTLHEAGRLQLAGRKHRVQVEVAHVDRIIANELIYTLEEEGDEIATIRQQEGRFMRLPPHVAPAIYIFNTASHGKEAINRYRRESGAEKLRAKVPPEVLDIENLAEV